MSITTYQVQNILRTYGKQLGRARKQSDQAAASEASPETDKVNISSEAKRQQVIAKIAQEIIGQITSQPKAKSQLENQALKQLSQEYGQPLEAFRAKEGALRFSVVDPESGNLVRELSAEEGERLAERFEEITRQIINGNMIA